MGRGFLAGIFWGAIVGLGLLLVSSQTMDRQQLSFPKPQATPVEVPAGTEFDQARPESDPVVPEVESAPASEIVSGVTPPEDAVETPPAFDTSSLEMPQPSIEAPGSLGDVPAVGEDITIDVTGPGADTPAANAPAAGLAVPETPLVAPDTETAAPEPGEAPMPEPDPVTEPSSTDTPESGTDVAALPDKTPQNDTPASDGENAPSVASDDTPPKQPSLPQITDTTSLPGTGEDTAPAAPPAGDAPIVAVVPDAAPDPAPALAPDAGPVAETETDPELDLAPGSAPGAAGIITVDGSDSSFFVPVESITDRAPDVETDRLPTIGGSDSDTTPAVAEAPADTATGPSVPEGAAALLRFRTSFDNPEGRPLISVVLVHTGEAPLSDAQIAGLPESVAFGVNAGQPRAAEIAAAYRKAGREVVMIPSLPQGATPQDVEVALRVNFERVPEAVAVMDDSGGGFQSDRAAVAQVVDVVTASGHGLITFPRGLNTAHQRAEKNGVPTGLIFRDLDGDGETDEQIRRTLDRAAFRARQSEAVILVGRTEPATMAALIEWALGNRAASVRLAPISAALLDG